MGKPKGTSGPGRAHELLRRQDQLVVADLRLPWELGVGFRVNWFSGLGFRGLGFRGLGFRVV